jgi:ribonuclease P protein component
VPVTPILEGAVRGEQYLTKPAQYALVYGKGSSLASRFLVLKTLANGLPLSRYGFSVSKKVGNAVVRNRMKRWLREILRATTLKSGRDIIFVVRPAASDTNYWELRQAVCELLSRARLADDIKETGVWSPSGRDPKSENN